MWFANGATNTGIGVQMFAGRYTDIGTKVGTIIRRKFARMFFICWIKIIFMPDYAFMNQCLYEGKAKEVEQMTKDALAEGRTVQEVLSEGFTAGMSVVV